jgi:GNAT superfamily N-acetyltransferase
MTIRRCRDDERATILDVVNDAAIAYRGVIPPDVWHEPYMDADELDRELADGVVFWACERDGELVAVMGIQALGDVDLIRHAYVRPQSQRHGFGGMLLEHLRAQTTRQLLVGTWAAAEWAIAFYRRHGFELLAPDDARVLLERYWTIPARQVETSVVLAGPPTRL